MGKFQLNKKGEDPIKIYEDVFKISQGTVESHLGKLGKQPKPISREVGDTEDRITKSYINQLDTVLNLLEDEELAKPHETLNVLNQFTQVEAIASEVPISDSDTNGLIWTCPKCSQQINYDTVMNKKLISYHLRSMHGLSDEQVGKLNSQDFQNDWEIQRILRSESKASEWESGNKNIHGKFHVIIKNRDTGEVAEDMTAGSLREAESIMSGASINMNHADWEIVIEQGESKASEWNSVEAITSEFYNDTGDAGRFLETPQLQQIRNHWDNVMPEEEKRSMLEGMAFLYKSSPTQKFDSLNWEVKESVALSVAGLVGLSIDMGTLYGQQHLDDLRNEYWD
jgi:hypothetical protein